MTRFLKILTCSTMLIVSVALTSMGWSAPLLFTDQGTFNTMVTNAGISLTTDGFEDLGAMGGLRSPLARTGYTLTEGDSVFISGVQSGSHPLVIEGTRSLTSTHRSDPLLFTFTNPINAFSILLGDISTSGDLTLALNGGTPLSAGLPIGGTIFRGVLDTAMPFSSVTIDRGPPPLSSGDIYEYDQVRFGAISETPGDPIPEPSTMLLFGSGLAGMVWWQHRKR